MDITMHKRRNTDGRARVRTCVGCGQRQDASDDASALLRLVVAEGEVAFDLAGGAFGRGVHVHPRPDCLARAPRGILRVLGKKSGPEEAAVSPGELGPKLVAACNQRMVGLLLAARRLGAVVVGADAAREALTRGALTAGPRAAAPLAIVASDAGSVAASIEVTKAAEAGRAIGWGAKSDLGALLGEQAVAICTVRHESIAAELKKTRALADAGAAATREGAECSRRPEAR